MTRILIPSGALGLGYDRDALKRGIEQCPDAIVIDGGSTDSGPYYLGTGTSKYSRASTKSEWAELMLARQDAGVPLIIGTAGTCGADKAVDWLYDITQEIAHEHNLCLKVAVLKSNQSPDHLSKAYQDGKIKALDGAPDIKKDDFFDYTNIVALAGAEQIQEALKTKADIIIAGRTTDTALISALPLMNNDNKGAAWHGAKIGECGALATTNPNSGVILIDFDAEGFTITPMGDDTYATPRTVSAHMLYENSNPFILHEPGGYLDVKEATYHSIDEKSVCVEGSHWFDAEQYNVKLEAARLVGYQSISLVLVRDPHYIKNIDQWCADIISKCNEKARKTISGEFHIELRIIGNNAVLGQLETDIQTANELGVLGIITAQSEALAIEIAKMLNPFLLHHPLTQNEEMPTFAFPFSPPEMTKGAVYEFCLHHILEIDDPMEVFSLEVREIFS